MRTATYNLNLRVGAGIPPIVKVSQNDEGRSIGFRLFDGALAYFPGATAEVTITGTKPSGLGFTETCSVSGSVAVVETTLAMTQESGQINAELRITDGSLNVGTTNFVLQVEPAPHPSGTTDGTTEEARTVLEQCAQYAQDAQEAAEATSGDYTQLSAEIGTLSELTTTAKSSAVAAINEVNSGLSDLRADLGTLDAYTILLNDNVPNTTQAYTFTDGKVSQIAHNRNSVAIRTDVFTYGTGTITEKRTLNTGKSVTLVTNLTTLETAVTYDGGNE